jgi:dynein heavy chain, axonemal
MQDIRSEEEIKNLNAPNVAYMMSTLDTLTSEDIAFLKSFKNPPASVHLVLQAICTLLLVPTTNKNGSHDWPTCRKIISDRSFLSHLINYDKDNVSNVVMNKIRTEFISNPNFDPEKYKGGPNACAALCKWVIALEKYDRTKNSIKNAQE